MRARGAGVTWPRAIGRAALPPQLPRRQSAATRRRRLTRAPYIHATRHARTTDAIVNSDSLFVYFSRASFEPFCVSEAARRRKKRRGWIELPEKVPVRVLNTKSFVWAFKLWKCSFGVEAFCGFNFRVEVQKLRRQWSVKRGPVRVCVLPPELSLLGAFAVWSFRESIIVNLQCMFLNPKGFSKLRHLLTPYRTLEFRIWCKLIHDDGNRVKHLAPTHEMRNWWNAINVLVKGNCLSLQAELKHYKLMYLMQVKLCGKSHNPIASKNGICAMTHQSVIVATRMMSRNLTLNCPERI